MFDLELKNKVAIITGGSDGLGRATARRFASEGAKVVICARREEHLMQAAEDLRKETNGSVLGMKADVCKAEDCTKLIDQTWRNSVGLTSSSITPASLQLQDWKH
ncbi:MAG: SDR family NAD(P)-dependent oxidoreductase [SAR324 cluster bacterium]|nr:SDR family NAD(P)-dependent oxidoreductase [SAR324 cluster bacterium]